MKLHLLVIEGPNKGTKIEINNGFYVIGRNNCHIEFPDKLLSSKHAALVVDSGKVQVRDLDSKNGTFVNNEKVSESVEVKDGDLINFGANVQVQLVSDNGGNKKETKVKKEKKNTGKKTIFDFFTTLFWKKEYEFSLFFDDFEAKISPIFTAFALIIFFVVSLYLKYRSFPSLVQIGYFAAITIIGAYIIPLITLITASMSGNKNYDSNSPYSIAIISSQLSIILFGLITSIAAYFFAIDYLVIIILFLPTIIIGTINYNTLIDTPKSAFAKPVIMSAILCAVLAISAIYMKITSDNLSYFKTKAATLLKKNTSESKLEAAKVLEEALKKFPDEITIRYTLSSVYLDIGKCDNARPHLRILKDNPIPQMTKDFAIKANECMKAELKKQPNTENVDINKQLEGL